MCKLKAHQNLNTFCDPDAVLGYLHPITLRHRVDEPNVSFICKSRHVRLAFWLSETLIEIASPHKHKRCTIIAAFLPYRRHEEIPQEVTVQAISYGPGSGYRYTQPTNTVIRTERTWIDPLPPQPFWDQYGRRVQ